MKKSLLLSLLFALVTVAGFSQSDKFWSANNESPRSIATDKAVARLAFPKTFRLFNLNSSPLTQELMSIVDGRSSRHSTIITLPNADGGLEQFEVFEASNFEPALQARFPEIRAFSGKGITDRYAVVKLSLSPAGIQTIVFRAEKESEFIEAYSSDHHVYAVFKSQRNPGQLPWTCSTEDHDLATGINAQVAGIQRPSSSTGELKTMRLAQSCNGEYSNYFGATSAAQVGLVLAAFNATLTRCNGVYEKDLALHLNLIANTADVIYYTPGTDPYTTLPNWNGQLQTTLTNVIGAANYDIGHMFGASGGGGNAGCIGCVCGAAKGSGITSPADGIPQGDNFDIDYVVHEVGHQLGANHTFSMSNEGSGVNKEVGSGITIMGYAGITNQDVAPHSIDIFHEASIQQIQVNLATKTCPITTNISATNATPVIAPLTSYTIPISTPFALTGVATDANAGDALTYCWEQNDNATNAQSGANSVASPGKTGGPNWLSFRPSTSPTRICPILPTILSGLFVTPTLPGGDAVANIEALSSVSRTLNFRLTVRDNSPYSSVAPLKVGQTSFADMVVTVSNTSGPFLVTQPNTNVSWAGGSTQTITWDVAGTTGAPVSCANVKISISTDGGLTFPTVLLATTANDGTETVTIPGTASTTARIKIESIGNIFFDISNTNFTITAPATGFTFNSVAPATVACGGASVTASLGTTAQGGFATPVNLTATGNPAGTTVNFSTNPVIPGNTTNVTLNNTNLLAPGTYSITITGVAGSVTQNSIVDFVVQPGIPPAITTQPSPVTVCPGVNAVFSIAASGTGLSYQWQENTGGGFTNITGANGASYTLTGVTSTQNNNQYQVIVSTLCGATTSTPVALTVNAATSITTQPAGAVICAGSNNTFSVTAAGTGLFYQWQESTTGCTGPFVNIPGANAATFTLSNVTVAQSGYAYQVVVTGTCVPTSVVSACATLTVSSSVGIATQPADVAACEGSDAVFTVVANGSGVNYQWQVSNGGPFTDIPGATTATLTVPAVTVAASGNQYQVVLTNSTCTTPAVSAIANLTVNELPSITLQPVGIAVCTGSSATFTASATGTNISYQWQVSTNNGTTFTTIAGATSASYTITATIASQNTYQYQVVVSGICTPAAVSNAAVLTVGSPVTITTQPADITVCSGEDASFTVAGAGALNITYQWQVSTGGGSFTDIPGETAPVLQVTAAMSAMTGNQYQVILSDGTCPVPLTSVAATLTVNALPVVTATSDAANVCTATAATLTASGAVSYTWQPGGLSGQTITVNPTVNPSTPGTPNPVTYTVTGTDANGCVGSGTVTVTANPLPAVTLTANPANTTLLPNQTVDLTATVDPVGTYIYTWTQNGVAISNSTATLTVGINNLGTYAVTASDASGSCATTSNEIVVTDSITNKFYIYPNPNDGQFNIVFKNPNLIGNVTVFDSRGSRIFANINTTQRTAYEIISVDLRPAGSGVYFVAIFDKAGDRLATEKIIVSH